MVFYYVMLNCLDGLRLDNKVVVMNDINVY